VFSGCSSLVRIDVDPENEYYESIDNGTKLVERKTGKVIWEAGES